MKIARLQWQGKVRVAVATGSGFALVGSGIASMAAALEPDARRALEQAEALGERVADGEAQLMVPFDPGARLFCVGVNYRSHAGETGRDIPAQPSIFIRTQESVVAAGDGMQRPSTSDHFDFEGELGVVIGRRGRNVPLETALDHVGGYTCFNDGSVRDFQKHSVTSGKNFESSGACGPWVVTADEIPDPDRLLLVTRLNGAEVQRSGLDLLIYSIPRIIEYVSTITTLECGDVIATGTPAGVGSRRTPPLWMKPGDTIEVDIARVGTLSNPIVQSA